VEPGVDRLPENSGAQIQISDHVGSLSDVDRRR
jgi:hypothetical protein